MIMRENRNEIKRYVRTQDLNVETCDAPYIRSWILGALKRERLPKRRQLTILGSTSHLCSAKRIRIPKCEQV